MTDALNPTPTIDAQPPSNETVADTVRKLFLNADNDVLSLVSGSINLYFEAKSRLTSKHRFTPEDARRILDMVMILLDVPNVAQDFTGAKPPAIVADMKARRP